MIPQNIPPGWTTSLAAILLRRENMAVFADVLPRLFQHSRFYALLAEVLTRVQADYRQHLPDLLEEPFLTQPVVSEDLFRYVITGREEHVVSLATHYAQTYYRLDEVRAIHQHCNDALYVLREALLADAIYGPLLLARGVPTFVIAANNWVQEIPAADPPPTPADRQLHEALSQQIGQLSRQPAVRVYLNQDTEGHIFMSYSRRDLPKVLQIRHALEDAGYRIWQDISAIKGGEDWERSIAEGIERSRAIITVVSAPSSRSRWVAREFLHAEHKQKPIIPFQVDDSEPPLRVMNLNIISGFPNFWGGISRLISDLPPVEVAGAGTAAVGLAARPAPPMVDARRDYLDTLFTPREHALKRLALPLAGTAVLEQAAPRRRSSVVLDDDLPMLPTPRPQRITEETSDAQALAARAARIALLGEPGSGKSTLLLRLADQTMQEALRRPDAPLPVLLRLKETFPGANLREKLQEQLGNWLRLDNLIADRQIALYVDGLNELPAEGRETHLAQLRELVQQMHAQDLVCVVTCRAEDYAAFDIGLRQTLTLHPLTPMQIHGLCVLYLDDPDEGARLFWDICGGEKVHSAWEKWQWAGVGDQFWTAQAIPEAAHAFTHPDEDAAWERAIRQGHSLLPLARTPYLVAILSQIYSNADRRQLPQDYAHIFTTFLHVILRRMERLDEHAYEALMTALGQIAYTLQREGYGQTAHRPFILEQIPPALREVPERANLLEGQLTFGFTHQLLQEYFAARHLTHLLTEDTAAGMDPPSEAAPDDAMPAEALWRRDAWWKPTGWETTLLFAAGLMHQNPTPLVHWLADAQPELTARCLDLLAQEHDLARFDGLADLVAGRWRERLLGDEPLEARAAVGRALAILDLDDRAGVGLRPAAGGAALPDIAWGTVLPAGRYNIGGDGRAPLSLQAQTVTIERPFRLARYPVTLAQFAAFLRVRPDLPRRPALPAYGSHPAEYISWEMAAAFAAWLHDQSHAQHLLPTGAEIRLPTEAEWEAAARYPDGRVYPWRGGYALGSANCDERSEGGGYLGSTSAVGVYTEAYQPESDLHDLAGNVWEWCAGLGGSPVLRGGAWNSTPGDVRAAARANLSPDNRAANVGFRLCLVLPVSAG